MNNTTISVTTTNHPATFTPTCTVKGYRVERRYEGDRTAAQVVSALMKVHDRKGAA
ncbi:MAG: hypothetical protein Q3985_04200 [Eubacteriales bacterium]|nr:hypothetical protein [Eubacteriales bacterium]